MDKTKLVTLTMYLQMDDKRVLPPPEVRGDTVTYVGLGIGALGLILTVVGLGDKVRLSH